MASGRLLVVGISGASGSGKTTLSTMLHDKIDNSVVLHQDDYYHSMGSEKLQYNEELKHYIWDIPSAVDMDRLVDDIETILRNTSISNSGKIVILEGNLIFLCDKIVALCNLKYFLIASKNICRTRIINRKYKRWDPLYFENVVWPNYELHKDTILKNIEDIVILNGDCNLSDSVPDILHTIEFYMCEP